MSGNARIAEVDVLRGLLAITVVLGHAVQQYETTIGGFWLAVKDFIYSFHMPAFVFISGFCAYRALGFSGDGQKAGFLKARARRLLVPYFAWGALYFILRALAGEHARVPYDYGKIGFLLLGYNPDGSMWFVWALFMATVLVSLAARWIGGFGLVALTFSIAAAAPFACPEPTWHTVALCALPTFVFFMSLGAMWRGWLERRAFPGGVRLRVFLLCCGMLFAGSYYLHVNCLLRPVPWYLLTATSATFLLYGLSRALVGKWRGAQRALALLGGEAMSIYVLGEPIKVVLRIVLSALGVPLSAAFPVMVVCMFALPIALLRIIRRNAFMRQLLLGEPCKQHGGSDHAGK